MTTILQARPRQFVNTPSVDRVAKRALRYLQSGYSVHLQGPAGTGKTTLALHLADLLTRPIMLLFGDDEFKTSDLIGNQSGFTRKKVFDNFIHSVVKMEDEVRQNWVDSRLTLACREGFTLVYDEFNRSRPEVNNVLLSALEEKLLVLPPNSSRSEYIRVNPHFRAIFTSNPAEYCGVHATQDALLDRLITINMPEPDELTQQEILVQKTEMNRESAVLIVQLVKAFRLRTAAKDSSGLRSCLMIAKIAQEHGIEVFPGNSDFRELCQDILLARSSKALAESTQILWDLFNTYQNSEVVAHPSANTSSTMMLTPPPLNEPLVHPEVVDAVEHTDNDAAVDAAIDDDSVNMAPAAVLADQTDHISVDPWVETVDTADNLVADTVEDNEVRLGKPNPEVPLTDTVHEIFGDDESLDSGDDMAIAPDLIQEALAHVAAYADKQLTEEERIDSVVSESNFSESNFSESNLSESNLSESEASNIEASNIEASNIEALDLEVLDVEASESKASGTEPFDPEVSNNEAPAANVLEGDVSADNIPKISPEISSENGEVSENTAPNDHRDAAANAAANDIVNGLVPSVPFEREVYSYLLQSHDARPSQIEAALGISRFQTVNALRSLTKKGLIASHSSSRNSNSSGTSSSNSAESSSINRHIRGHIIPPHGLAMQHSLAQQPPMMYGGDAV